MFLTTVCDNLNQVGDNQAAGASLKAAIGDMESFDKISRETAMEKTGKSVVTFNCLPEPNKENQMTLADIPDSLLGEFVQSNAMAYDELTSFAETFSHSLEEIDPLLFASLSSHESSEEKTINFQFGSDTPGSSSKYPQYGVPAFSVNQHAKGFTLPEISTFLSASDSEHVMSKHQVRTDHLGDICLPQCRPSNLTCNCKKLFGCVQDMTEVGILS